MDHKCIENNLDEIKIDKVIINEDKNIVIPILYNNEEISIKVPEYKDEYFKLQQINHDLFNYCLTLKLMDNIDDFEEEYKDDFEKISNQKEAFEFNNFILKLKDKIINTFFNEIKVNKNYLNMINFSELNLEEHEIDRAIWNENVDFSYISEIKKIEEEKYITGENDEDILNEEDKRNFETIIRHSFHVNKKTKKEKNYILKCNVIFINKPLDDKKHIYINWFII
jgi:hypothetical protein